MHLYIYNTYDCIEHFEISNSEDIFHPGELPMEYNICLHTFVDVCMLNMRWIAIFTGIALPIDSSFAQEKLPLNYHNMSE